MKRTDFLAALAVLLLGGAPAARADLLGELGGAVDDGVRKTKKVVKKVKKKVKKAGKEVEEEVDEEVEVVVNGAGQVIGEVDKTSRKTVRLALKGQKALEKSFSKAAVDDILEGLDETFRGPQQAAMWAAVVARLKQARPPAERAARDTRALAERVRKAGEQWKASFDDAYAFIARLVGQDASQKKLGRLFALVAKGRFGDEVDRLAQWLADEAASVRQGARRAAQGPGLYPTQSFGLTLGWNISAHVAVAGGFEGRFGVVMNIGRDGKVSDVRAVYTLAEGLGAGASATGAGIDAGVDLMLSASAQQVKNASGLFFGPSGSAGAGISGNVGLEWGWVGDNPAPAPIPDIAAGPGISDPDPSVSVLVLYGYAVTANGQGFDHGIPGLPAK